MKVTGNAIPKNKIKTCLSNMKSLPISFILKNRKAITFKILYTMFSMNKSLYSYMGYFHDHTQGT